MRSGELARFRFDCEGIGFVVDVDGWEKNEESFVCPVLSAVCFFCLPLVATVELMDFLEVEVVSSFRFLGLGVVGDSSGGGRDVEVLEGWMEVKVNSKVNSMLKTGMQHQSNPNSPALVTRQSVQPRV